MTFRKPHTNEQTHSHSPICVEWRPLREKQTLIPKPIEPILRNVTFLSLGTL